MFYEIVYQCRRVHIYIRIYIFDLLRCNTYYYCCVYKECVYMYFLVFIHVMLSVNGGNEQIYHYMAVLCFYFHPECNNVFHEGIISMWRL